MPWCAGASGSAGLCGLGADAGQAGTGKPRQSSVRTSVLSDGH